MKRTRKFLAVFAVLFAVNAVPTVAHAEDLADTCRWANNEAKKYGWNGDICIIGPLKPEDPND